MSSAHPSLKALIGAMHLGSTYDNSCLFSVVRVAQRGREELFRSGQKATEWEVLDGEPEIPEQPLPGQVAVPQCSKIETLSVTWRPKTAQVSYASC